MSRTELHNWECVIESLCGDNADKILAIAQDIYNTAYVHGKNYMSLEQELTLNEIRADIEEVEIYDGCFIDRDDVLEIIDNYRESEE